MANLGRSPSAGVVGLPRGLDPRRREVMQMVMIFSQGGEREYHSLDEIGQDDGQSEVTISRAPRICCNILKRALLEGFVVVSGTELLIGGCVNDGIKASLCPFCGDRW